MQQISTESDDEQETADDQNGNPDCRNGSVLAPLDSYAGVYRDAWFGFDVDDIGGSMGMEMLPIWGYSDRDLSDLEFQRVPDD